jgi:PAS domain S-box-containing protein
MTNPKKRKDEAAPLDLGAFKDFLEAVGAAVLVLSPDRKILQMNSAARRAWGSGAAVGKDCYRVLRNAREPCPDCPFDELLTSHRWIKREMRMSTDAGWRTHENLYIYIRGETPDRRVITVVSTDIHEARSLQREVYKEKELSRALLESVNSLVLGFDSDGTLEFVNKALETATGFTEAEINSGGGVRVLIPKDALSAAEDYFLRPADERSPSEPVLIPVLTKAGARRMISWTYSPLFVPNGEVAGAIALGQDVTERFTRRTEAERRAAELEIVNSILSGVGGSTDFEETLSRSLDHLLSLPGYRAGAAFVLEAGASEARLIAAKGFRGRGPWKSISGTARAFPATAVYNKRIEVVRAGAKAHRHVEEVIREEQLGGMVAVPLFPGGHPAALLMLGYEGERNTEDLGMGVLQACAEGLELGAENAFLRLRAEQRAKEATALFNVSQHLTGTLDLHAALNEVAHDAAELLEADLCGIFIADEGSDSVKLTAGYPPDAIPGLPNLELGLTEHRAGAEVAQTLRPLAIYDVSADERVPDYVSARYGIKSSLYVPLSAEGKFTGVIYLAMTTKHRLFTGREAQLMESFARQASIAIKNASLVNDLRESEERYRAIMENSGVGFVVHDGDNILYANARAGDILGYGTDRFKKVTDIVDLSPPDERKKMLESLARRRSGHPGAPGDYDVRIERSDGSVAVVQLMHTRMTMGGREVVLVAANDVTDRVEAEEAVRASEERYRTLIESSRDAIIIADPQGTVLFSNSTSVLFTGKSAADVIGTSIYDYVHPEDKATTLKRFKREWEAGRSVARFPVRALVDGEEKFFEVTTAILGDPGPKANVMVILSDVTARVLAQWRLEESEDRYRTIVETTHDAIVSVNRAGEILYANQAVQPLFGVSPEDARGRNIFKYVHPEAKEMVARELDRDFKTGKAEPNLAIRCVREDGTPIHVEVNSGLVGWPGESAIEILVIRDVTERYLHEEARERQLKVEEALSSMTAKFVDPVDVYDAIDETLGELSRFLGGSRAYYFELGGDGHTITRVLERGGGEQQFSEVLAGADSRDFAYLTPRFLAGEEVFFEDASELPGEVEKEFIERFHITSFASVPLFSGGTLRGLLGYASTGVDRQWTRHDVDLLREIARTVSRALERREFIEELGRSERFRARITESIGEGLFVMRNGVITWANPRMSEISGYSLEELQGKNTEFLIPQPARFEPVASDLVTSLTSEGVYSVEDKLVRKDSSVIDVQFYVTALGVTENGEGELLTAVQDITESKKMRDEVEAAAEAYSTIFSSAGDSLIVHTEAGDIIDANEKAVLCTGYDRDALLKMNMRDLVPERLRSQYEELEELAEEKGSITFETRVLRPDGSIVPMEATSRLTRIWGEMVILSAMRDISERKKAEEETNKRAAQLASLNEIVKAATSSLDLDTVAEAILRVAMEVGKADAGMVVLGSPAGRSAQVVTSNQSSHKFHPALGQAPTRELLAWLAAERRNTLLVEPDGDEEALKTFSFAGTLLRDGPAQALFIPLYSGDKSIGVIALGSSKPGVFDPRDCGFYDATGAEIGVSIENALIYKELTAEHERLSLLYRTAQSISGELELDALLHRTAEEAAHAFGSRSALIGLVEPGSDNFVFSAGYNVDLGLLEGLELATEDGIGGAVVSNKRTVTIPPAGSRTPEQRKLIENDPVLQVTGVDFAVATPLIAGDRVLGVFSLERRPGGQEFSPEDTLLLEAIGRQAGVAIQNARLYEETRRHLEALEEAHRELMVLDRMKSDFVSTVSHELRSPLAVIEGFAKTMSEHFDRIDVETQKESIEIILKKAIALEGLIENILDMSRIEDGRLEVYREPFDVVLACETVTEDQEQVAEVHEVRVESDGRPVIVIADREKTEVAIGNLVRNALKFSPGGGAVVVSVKEARATAEISVSDEGIGIAPDNIERIFDRFYQVDSSETRSFPGSGLGLYITRELVQSMGGSIRVESEPGRGSTFTFTLPLAR